ncbi:MAG: hypothetical protein AAF609_09700 [Cyanobacteria bacterium P01_C01_bin.120]
MPWRRAKPVATLTYRLSAIEPLRVKVKRLYLDRGFFQGAGDSLAEGLESAFFMPALIRGKIDGTRAWCRGRKSYDASTPSTVSLMALWTVREWSSAATRKSLGSAMALQHLLYVTHRLRVAPHHVHQRYRDRFGIETNSYRIKNHCRIRMTHLRMPHSYALEA